MGDKVTDKDAVRWATGDELSDAQVQELTEKLRRPAADKSDFDLVDERRYVELNQRLKN